MKADVTLAGDTLHVVVENSERKFDGTFALTFESPMDAMKLGEQLSSFGDQIQDYVSQFLHASNASTPGDQP